jgi:hypothetical protein
MESKRIPLKGIVRNSSSQLSEDGEMIDVINLRNKYGKLQPIKDAEKVYQSQYPIVYIHKNLDYENWISYDGNTGNLYWEAKKENNVLNPVNEVITQMPQFSGIAQTGNILSFITNEYFYNILFNNGYKVIPPFETISCKISIKKQPLGDNFRTFTYEGSRLRSIDKNLIVGDINKYADTLKENGEFYNSLLVRYSFRLYDGSYVLTSNPIPFIMYGLTYKEDTNNDKTYIYMQHYKLSFKSTIDGLSLFKDIIVALDIFACEIPTYDGTDYYPSNVVTNQLFTSYNFKEKIEQAHNFYLIESIDIKDLLETPTDLSKSIPTNKDYVINLTSQKELENEQSRGGISANHIFNYNSKIHLSDIKNNLFKGYTLQELNNGYFSIKDVGPSIWEHYFIKVFIKTNNAEDSIVIRKDFNLNSSPIYPSPYLSYPNPNAYKIQIGINGNYGSGSSNNETWVKTFYLKPHPFLDIAYYYGAEFPYGKDWAGDQSFEEFEETIGEEINPIIEESSKIKVSSINNPFVFPPEQTYTVGSGDILGMASVTAALSQGQFGQFPLYVFTTEGIWALQVGTGEVAYTTANPVSRDVCNNSDSITPIDNAVIFTTEKGVNIISGSSVKSLSDDLDGETINISNDSSVYFIQNLAEAIATIGLQSSFNDELFTDYIRTARLAYNYNEGEIYAINTSKNYYYCYSIANKEWSKRSAKFKGIIESYPNLYLQNDDNEIFKVNNENGNLKQWIFISRPVKLTGIQHKRIIRSFLRGLYNSTNSSKIAFSIFGSFDGERFELVNSVQGIAKNQRDILLGRSIRPYTYFIFAAYASSGTESEISAIDVMFEQVKRTLAI